MAEITYPHFDQHYGKYIFRNSMSHNLQRAKENGNGTPEIKKYNRFCSIYNLKE